MDANQSLDEVRRVKAGGEPRYYTMPTGEVLESSSPEYRLYCEAWWVATRLHERGWSVGQYLGLVEKRRGKASADLLRAEMHRVAPAIGEIEKTAPAASTEVEGPDSKQAGLF